MIVGLRSALLTAVALTLASQGAFAGALDKYLILPPANGMTQAPAPDTGATLQRFEIDIQKLGQQDKLALMRALSHRQTEAQQANDHQSANFYAQLIGILAKHL